MHLVKITELKETKRDYRTPPDHLYLKFKLFLKTSSIMYKGTDDPDIQLPEQA